MNSMWSIKCIAHSRDTEDIVDKRLSRAVMTCKPLVQYAASPPPVEIKQHGSVLFVINAKVFGTPAVYLTCTGHVHWIPHSFLTFWHFPAVVGCHGFLAHTSSTISGNCVGQCVLHTAGNQPMNACRRLTNQGRLAQLACSLLQEDARLTFRICGFRDCWLAC